MMAAVFRWIEALWAWRGGWACRLLCGLLLLGAFGCFAVVGLLLWTGDVWARFFYAERPLSYLFGGLAFLLGWHVARRGYRYNRAEWRAFLARCALLAVSAVLSFAVGEVALRLLLMRQQQGQSFTRWQQRVLEKQGLEVRSSHPLAHIIRPSLDKQLVFELRPALDVVFSHRRLRTSLQGFREDREYPLERSPNSVRIVGIGDSGMFGWNMEQGWNYLDLLEQRLNQRGDGILYEALNMAVPGCNTALEVEMLRSKGLAFKPDIVVVGWSDNDFQLPFFLLERENFMRTDRSYLYTLMFNRTNLAEIVAGERIADLRAFEQNAVNPDVRAGAEETGVETALRRLMAMSREHNFHALMFGAMRENIVTLCRRVGVPYYNTRERIPGDRYPGEWAVHFFHPAAEGHEVLAKYLEEALVERGWIQPNNEDGTSHVQTFNIQTLNKKGRKGRVSFEPPLQQGS